MFYRMFYCDKNNGVFVIVKENFKLSKDEHKKLM